MDAHKKMQVLVGATVVSSTIAAIALLKVYNNTTKIGNVGPAGPMGDPGDPGPAGPPGKNTYSPPPLK